jgi:DNA polymerase
MYLIADFETRSEAEITEVGLHNYAIHPSTRALMLGWRIVKDLADRATPVEIWESEPEHGRFSAMPKQLSDAINDPLVDIIAHNSAFERYIFEHVLGIKIPAERFQDTQPSARYLSLPSNLEQIGIVLGLPRELRKDKRGKQLMELFSFPQTRKKKEGGGTYFNDKNSHPVEWEEYKEYCKQDCVAEQEVARREMLLGVFPLPERERRIWLFDQKVNDRGMPTDRVFVEKAFAIADKNKQEKLKEQNDATGLENANSSKQLLPWVQERGYPLNNLRKQNIELILKAPLDAMGEGSIPGLSDECRKVLEARMEAGSTSYKKLQSILRNISPDNRLRNQFIYGGSSRCLRWSGNAVQLHNMARPDATFEDLGNVKKARNFIYEDDYHNLKTAFVKDQSKLRINESPLYSPLLIAKNVIRTAFVAPEGKRFNVCDLNAIETRVGAWFAGCQSLLDVFDKTKYPPNGRDPYLDFAVKMTGIPYDKLAADIKSKDMRIKSLAKRVRQMAKPGVLGAIYRMGGGRWATDENGDRYKTGLWGYAESMGIDMTQEEAHQVVKIFRESYPEICGNGYNGQMKGMWVILEEAIADVLGGERTVRYVGPDNCIKIDKVTIEGRQPMLRIQLPSGRYLHYLDSAIETVKMPWTRKNQENGEDEDVYRPAFTYYGTDQDTKQWTLIVSHGGKTFENIVQGIARDVLADKLLEFEAAGLEVCGHVHDEGIALSQDDPFAPGVLKMEAIMNTPVKWAPSLPLGSDGFESDFYHK